MSIRAYALLQVDRALSIHLSFIQPLDHAPYAPYAPSRSLTPPISPWKASGSQPNRLSFPLLGVPSRV